ncbi:hypothetical protein SBOR_5628 [Sclerotinia borealis F-4128]|uniref:Uncharacterized protein n=1 Tax=Sclerotinia borealis (strain F-4128) TaxID=1432307 RepID=W9CB64_SCLBF|nr:hypothetical protein SBOR_5628 [Sclerotinia borealis F-4128]
MGSSPSRSDHRHPRNNEPQYAHETPHECDIYNYHNYFVVRFQGTPFGEEPNRKPFFSKKYLEEGDMIHFTHLRYRKVQISNSDKVYIELPKTFIEFVKEATSEKRFQDPNRPYLEWKWESGLKYMDKIPRTHYCASPDSKYVEVPQWDFLVDLQLEEAGEFNGFVTFMTFLNKSIKEGIPKCNYGTLHIGNMCSIESTKKGTQITWPSEELCLELDKIIIPDLGETAYLPP